MQQYSGSTAPNQRTTMLSGESDSQEWIWEQIMNLCGGRGRQADEQVIHGHQAQHQTNSISCHLYDSIRQMTASDGSVSLT